LNNAGPSPAPNPNPIPTPNLLVRQSVHASHKLADINKTKIVEVAGHLPNNSKSKRGQQYQSGVLFRHEVVDPAY